MIANWQTKVNNEVYRREWDRIFTGEGDAAVDRERDDADGGVPVGQEGDLGLARELDGLGPVDDLLDSD